MSDSQPELDQLKANAENLAKCLHALLERIDNLERKTSLESDAKKGESGMVDGLRQRKGQQENGEGNDNEKQEQVVIEDNITVDPVSGLKKRTITTERVLTTKTFHALNMDIPTNTASNSNTLQISNGRLLSPVYQSRAVTVDARQLNQIEVEPISGQMVVTRVNPSSTHDIHPGDTILEINGMEINHPKQLQYLSGQLTLTLVPAAIHIAPPVFMRALSDYSSDADPEGCRWLPIDVRKGEVIQVISSDNQWMQARKVNDLSRVGYIPSDLATEKVSMLCPYGRRVLVLLGCVGVGRRTLKSMILHDTQQHFATVVPMTTRPQRSGEQEGRDYVYSRKEEMLKKIRDGEMIEWGELDGQLYGTTAESIRTVIRSGRMCVVDSSPQALSYLYNGEFMPFVVHVVPPPFEEFLQLEQLRNQRRPADKLSEICAASDAISNGPYANQIHLTLINRNLDVTFKRLKDALESLRLDTQWIPESWMC